LPAAVPLRERERERERESEIESESERELRWVHHESIAEE
jgi:hypothetical protein